jgi:ubiquinone/menaquinone biosynthesis C-methylase UbiE
MSLWQQELIDAPDWKLGDIYIGHTEGGLGTTFHEKMPRGAALRELSKKALHLAYWETPYYEKAITGFLGDIADPSKCTAVDIGCGDGRFTELLLRLGFARVIATDAHLVPLQSLQQFAKSTGQTDRLLLIQCGADQLPLRAGSVDAALAIGVFYYLNGKYEKCLKEVHRVLRPGGTLVNSEPDLEGAVYKSLFFEEVEDALENFREKKFKEEKGRTDFKFRLFSQQEMQQILAQHGFRVVDQHGLSLLPSILRIKMVRGEIPEEVVMKNEKEIRQLFDHFDREGKLAKHIIWKSLK